MKLNMNDPLIKEKMKKIESVILRDDIFLYFLPSVNLKNIVAKGEAQVVKDLPDVHKASILSGEGIYIQKRMVLAWIQGKLDEKNAFILSNGDIRMIIKKKDDGVENTNVPIIADGKENKDL
jgi:hypothetical protein